MNEALTWFLLGAAVGITGTVLVFSVRTLRSIGASAPTDAQLQRDIAAAIDRAGFTDGPVRVGSVAVESQRRGLAIVPGVGVRVDGVAYRSLADVPAADRGLVADELRLSRDLLVAGSAERGIVDAFLADDGDAGA